MDTITTDRVVRVFVSSTFLDMMAERDHLVKFIFPQLRKLCEARGVTWGEVDLRWGITNEETAEGRVLPLWATTPSTIECLQFAYRKGES